VESIKGIFYKFFQSPRWSEFKISRILEVWGKIVGTKIAHHCQPQGFRDNILQVTVDSPLWMQQLKFLEPKIREKLNQEVGEDIRIKKIYFRIGEINLFSPKQSKTENPPSWLKVELDETVKEKIEQEVAFLKDEELKTRLKNLFYKSSKFLHYKGKA